MANCDRCINLYVEDLDFSFDCKKHGRIHYDEDECLSEEEFYCKDFEEMKLERRPTDEAFNRLIQGNR